MKNRLKRIAQGLLLAMGATALTLLGLELIVRLVAPQQLIAFRRDIWQPKDGVGWHHAPHADSWINTGERDVRFQTDGNGHRIGKQPPHEHGWRVLALGDSFLEAIQVQHEDTFAHRLETGLTETLGPGRVVNTGVGGWDPNHYLIEARDELDRMRYDAVVVFFFVGNDAVPYVKEHYDPRPSAEQPGLRIPRGLSRGELISAIAYPINNALESNAHLFVLAKNRLKFLLMRVGLSAHYFPPSLMRENRDAKGWGISTGIVRAITDEAAARGLPTLVVLLPGVYQVDDAVSGRYVASLGLDPVTVDVAQPSSVLAPLLAAHGLPVVDTLPALRTAHTHGAGPLYGHVDTHLAPEGHRVVAETVMPMLRDLLATALDASSTSDADAAPLVAPSAGDLP